MIIEINLDRKAIEQTIEEKIANEVASNELRMNYKAAIRDGIEKGTKNYIYKREDEIIEWVVERATKRIVKKIAEENILKAAIKGLSDD